MDDEENTEPFIVIDEIQLARGTRRDFAPVFMAGDWVVSPSGVEGYIAGRSLDNPGYWLFIVKTGESGWDQSVVEMKTDAFVGFKRKEREGAKTEVDLEAV